MVLATGCKRREAPPPAESTASATEAPATTSGSAATAGQGTRARLGELEAHLRYGDAWGSSAPATRIAKAILADDAIASRKELAVAVEETAAPAARGRAFVILVKMKYLKEEDSADRKTIVELIQEDIAEHLDEDDHVTLGIRGPVAYGVVAHGSANKPRWSIKTGRVLGTESLEAALAPPNSAGEQANAR